MRLLYQDSHKMADITDISDEEFEEIPVRKPIGWNYQNVNKSQLMEGKIMGQKTKITIAEGKSNSNIMQRMPSSDDIEVLEIVDIKNSSKPKPLFPESSSRRELMKLSRDYSKQSSIKKYFNNDEGKNNKLSLSKRYVKLESSSLKNEELYNPRNDRSEKNNVSNIHNGNEKSGITYKNEKVENETKETLVNITKPECPLVRIELSIDNENEESVVKPEASNKDMENCAIEKDKSLPIPGSSATIKEVDSDITSEYSKSLIERFIDKWKCLEGFGGDDFLICDKLWKYYYSCHSTYTHSRKFCNGLNKAISDINTNNKYVLIKDIIDTMKRYKETPYIEKKSLKSSQEADKTTVLSEVDMRNQRKLKRLEMAMIKVHKKITALEMEECDLDDDENSSYLMLDRLKSYFMKLDDKYCKLANCSTATGRPVEKKFKYEGSRYSEINQRITVWVNKHREFPEFLDVLKLVKEVTKTSCLPMRPETVRVEAQEIFRDVGKMLQARRQKDDLFSIYAYAGEDSSIDPAGADPDLYKQLKLNGKEAKEKLDKVFDHFYEKELEEREKTNIKNKKDGNSEEVANQKENKIEDKKNEESVTNNNDERDIKFDDECGTLTESEGVIDDDEEILESCSESDHSVENGRLIDTNGNNDVESEISEFKAKNSTLEADYKRISVDISDASDDEEIIETASNDSLLPEKELNTNIEDEHNGNSVKCEQSDVSRESSEEDILIADSPDVLEENYEKVSSYSPISTSNVVLTNSRKRKLYFHSNVSKKSHIESSPEIVELD